jgi:iron complex transport system substrate-binding protein
VRKVFAAGPPASVFVLALAPEKLAGWTRALHALNRMLGVEWLVRILHPQTFPEPLGPRIADFHRRFYHHVPTDAQVASLLFSAGLQR